MIFAGIFNSNMSRNKQMQSMINHPNTPNTITQMLSNMYNNPKNKSLSIKQIISTFNNRNIKKLVNVYQSDNFKNGPPPGLGDYLRGCFCTLQVSILLGLEFDMNLKNHPLSMYLNISEEQKSDSINSSELHRFENLNYSSSGKTNSPDFLKDFMNHLNSLNVSSNPNIDAKGAYFFFCNSFPIYDNFSNMERQIIRLKMEPNDMMKENINLHLQKLGVDKKGYQVIHIRCGDDYIKDVHINDRTHITEKGISITNNMKYVNNILNILSRYINHSGKYVVISDNNEIKILIKNKFPNTIIQLNEIKHLGSSVQLSNSGIMYTLLDFYTMAFSTNILSLSSYSWGSGFSKWSSVIYNIPYISITI